MIIQSSISEIKSRNECNPYLDNGYLPLITAPMSCVVDENNYKVFTENKIQVCLPRTIDTIFWEDNVFISMSLNEFIEEFLERTESFLGKRYVCIDTANGNMQILHEAITKAKEQHGDNLIIMAGNVSTVSSFYNLALTGCDFIRVGIGGGSGCNTTSNIGIGQEDLGDLIYRCYHQVQQGKKNIQRNSDSSEEWKQKCYNEALKLGKVKIVADGISAYINQCKVKYGFNDNGYAAINKLLWLGADLIMIGSLFSQTVESAAVKYIHSNGNYLKVLQKDLEEYLRDDTNTLFCRLDDNIYAKYYGMSSFTAQELYRTDKTKYNEGSIEYILVRYYLSEWLNGSPEADIYPYLSGWINSIKSAMSYTNSLTIKEFKIEKN